MDTTTLSKKRLFDYLIADEIQLEEEVINKAKENDDESFFSIGDIYYGKNDYLKAMDWYQLAAGENNAYSQWRLGYMYQYGKGVYIDYKIAMKWYLKAHDNGDVRGTNSIGFLYCNGLGVNQDYKTAFKLFLGAANKGDKIAQYFVGLFYGNGCGVKIDKQYALEWFEKSAEQGDEYAKYEIEKLNREGFYIDDRQKKYIQMEKDITGQKERVSRLEKKLESAEREKDNEIRLLKEENKILKLEIDNCKMEIMELTTRKDQIHQLLGKLRTMINFDIVLSEIAEGDSTSDILFGL